jgi:hydrogenase maturation protease
MTETNTRCLILACGNTLRGDDGVGMWLAEWAEEQFRAVPSIRVISQQQWTPELAEDIAQAESVVFIDCCQDSAPGVARVVCVEPCDDVTVSITHHLGAPQLLALGRELYASLPRNSMLLTVGASSLKLGEELSSLARTALPEACELLENTVLDLLVGR